MNNDSLKLITICRFVLQGKLEFSARTSGLLVRKINYTEMLAGPSEIITEEELNEFEDALEEHRIPDNLSVGNMWHLFRHYQSGSLMTTIFKWGGLALGVLGIAMAIYMGISRFCPRLVGKQVGFSPVAQAVGTGTGGGINIHVAAGGGQEDGGGNEFEMQERLGEGTEDLEGDMSTAEKYKHVLTPKFSRKLISGMTRNQRKAICQSADMIRKVEGHKTYNTESDEESGNEDNEKKVELVTYSCRNCGKDVKLCKCRDGLVPDWKKELCVNCMKDEKHCSCEEFKKFPKYHPLA